MMLSGLWSSPGTQESWTQHGSAAGGVNTPREPLVTSSGIKMAIVWILNVHQRPMCWRVGNQSVVLL